MRKVPVGALVPGMRLAKRVLGPANTVYLNAGVILTSRYIQRLKELGFGAVYVHDRLLDEIEVPDVTDVIDEETRREAIGCVRELLLETADSGVKVVKPPEELTRCVSEMVDQIVRKPSCMIDMADIRSQDEYLYHHSVNVCVLALTTGVQMGMSRAELFELGVGALLHDVGKMRVPAEILNKPGRLTPEEFTIVKRHPLEAEKLLRDNPAAAVVAGKHHERVNGEGYPRGLRGSEIDRFSQITGIADVFDALIADRCYRKGYPPHEAVEMLLAAGNYWFDYDLVQHFLANVAAYPVGTLVELDNREIGVVVNNPKGFPTLPVVRVFLTLDDGWLRSPYELSTLEKCRYVARVLGEEEVAFIRSRFS